MIAVEDRIRRENGQPSLAEELEEIKEEARLRSEIEAIKAKMHKER